MCFIVDDLIEAAVTIIVVAAEASPYLAVGGLALEGAALIACAAGDPALAAAFGGLGKIFGFASAISGVAGALDGVLDEATSLAGDAADAGSDAADAGASALDDSPITLTRLVQMHQFMTSFGSLGLEIAGDKQAASYLGMFGGMTGGALSMLGEATGQIASSSLQLAQAQIGGAVSGVEFGLTQSGDPKGQGGSLLGELWGAADSALGFADMALGPARPSIDDKIQNLTSGLHNTDFLAPPPDSPSAALPSPAAPSPQAGSALGSYAAYRQVMSGAGDGTDAGGPDLRLAGNTGPSFQFNTEVWQQSVQNQLSPPSAAPSVTDAPVQYVYEIGADGQPGFTALPAPKGNPDAYEGWGAPSGSPVNAGTAPPAGTQIGDPYAGFTIPNGVGANSSQSLPLNDASDPAAIHLAVPLDQAIEQALAPQPIEKSPIPRPLIYPPLFPPPPRPAPRPAPRGPGPGARFTASFDGDEVDFGEDDDEHVGYLYGASSSDEDDNPQYQLGETDRQMIRQGLIGAPGSAYRENSDQVSKGARLGMEDLYKQIEGPPPPKSVGEFATQLGKNVVSQPFLPTGAVLEAWNLVNTAKDFITGDTVERARITTRLGFPMLVGAVVGGILETPTGLAADNAATAEGLEIKGPADLAGVETATPAVPNLQPNPSFTGQLRGEAVTLEGVGTEEIIYTKRAPEALQALRNEFNATARSQFLEDLAADPDAVDRLKASGLTDADIEDMGNGMVPDGYQVHHKLPLDDGGTNDPSNLILIENEPYHKVITNAQNAATRGMVPGETRVIQFPIPRGFVYP